MTQEDKELLLKDLTARLLHRVVVVGINEYSTKIGILSAINIPRSMEYTDMATYCSIDGESPMAYYTSVKPYLRPMSSMTEEEEIYYNTIYTTLKFYEKEDWLNAHHFDYHGLISMGLALEAPKDIYKTE